MHLCHAVHLCQAEPKSRAQKGEFNPVHLCQAEPKSRAQKGEFNPVHLCHACCLLRQILESVYHACCFLLLQTSSQKPNPRVEFLQPKQFVLLRKVYFLSSKQVFFSSYLISQLVFAVFHFCPIISQLCHCRDIVFLCADFCQLCQSSFIQLCQSSFSHYSFCRVILSKKKN